LSSKDLGETALKVYAALLESGKPLGPREVAKILGLPVSTAYYNLKKLEELGLVEKAPEGYVVSKPSSVEGYVVLARRLVPRLVVYSMFFLGVLVGELVLVALKGASPDRLLAIVVSLAASATLLAEGLSARRKLRGSLKACRA